MFSLGINIGMGISRTENFGLWYTAGKADGVDPKYWADFIGERYAINGVSTDFATATGHSRASSGTYYNNNGLVKTASSNVGRFTYDPTTLAKLGFLLEESRTNLVTYSEDLTQAAMWTLGQASVSNDAAVVNPTGATGAYKLVEDSTVGTYHHIFSTSTTIVPSGIGNVCVFAKAGTRDKFAISCEVSGNGRVVIFDLVAKTAAASSVIGSGGTVTTLVGDIVELPNGWFRCSVSAATSGANRFAFKLANAASAISYNGDGASYLYLWGAQCEAADNCSSYIATSGASATRASDICSYNSFAAIANLNAGTLLFDGLMNGNANGGKIALGSGVDGSNYFATIYNTTALAGSGGSFYRNAAVTQASTTPPVAPTYKVRFKSATTFAVGLLKQVTNGTLGADQAGPTAMAAQSSLRIGSSHFNATSSANVIIREARYYDFRVTNAELQRITT